MKQNQPGDAQNLLDDHCDGHSPFQIERFIINRGNWTPYGRYKQVLRELDKRRRGLEELESRRQLLDIDREELVQSLASWPRRILARLCRRGSLNRRRDAIKLRQMCAALAGVSKEIETVRQEMGVFQRLAGELRPAVGELTADRRRRLDEELWDVRIRAMAAADLITCRSLSDSTLDLLLSLPLEMRTRVLGDVRATIAAMQQGRDGPLVAWLERHEGPSNRVISDAAPSVDLLDECGVP